MVKSLVLCAAIVFAAGVSTGARADDAAMKSNVHCLIVGFSMTQNADPDQQGNGLIVSTCYFGKLDGLATKAELSALIAQESVKMTGDVFMEEAVRCGRELTARGQVLQQIGTSLQKGNACGQPKAETSPP